MIQLPSDGAKGRVVQAKNATGTTTASGSVINTLVDIPSTGITVPANSPDNTVLRFHGHYLSGSTAGEALLALVETTSTPTVIGSVVMRIAGDASVGSSPMGEFDLGAAGASARTFKLQIEFITAGAQFSMLNSASNPTVLKAVSE